MSFDAAEVVKKLTDNFHYRQLQDYEKKSNYYQLIFYGDTLQNSSSLDSSDIRKQPDYRSWALSNNAVNFMSTVKNGIETPVYANVIADTIRSLADEIVKAKKADRLSSAKSYIIDFGVYYGAVIYFGKQFVLEKHYNDATIMSNIDYVKNTLCPDAVSDGIKYLADYYGISESKMKKDKRAIYLLNASFATKEFRDAYKKTKDDYFASVKDVMDMLKNHPNLQLCINSVDMGDTIMMNNDASAMKQTVQIQQAATCIQAKAGELEEEEQPQPQSQPQQQQPETTNKDFEKQDEDYGKDDNKENKEEDKTKNKTGIIVGVSVGVVVIIIIFTILIIFLIKRNKQKQLGIQDPQYGINSEIENQEVIVDEFEDDEFEEEM